MSHRKNGGLSVFNVLVLNARVVWDYWRSTEKKIKNSFRCPLF